MKGTAFVGATLAAAASVLAARRSDAVNAQAVVEQFAATLSARDIASFTALFADDYLNHQLSAAVAPPLDRSPKQVTVDLFAGRLIGLPDLRVEVEATVASGDQAAASFAYSGTHRGPFLGVAPTGKRLRFTSCDIFRVRNGLIIEHWGMGDTAGVLTQLHR